MAVMETADTVRMRVQLHKEIEGSGAGPSATTGCERVVCAVGEIAAGSAVESVVWIRGGAKHDVGVLECDASSGTTWMRVEPSAVRVKPSGVSDEAALLADDVAAMIHAAKIAESRGLQNLAVFTTSKTISCAISFATIVNEMYDHSRQPRPAISIVLMDSVPADADISSPNTQARTLFHEDLLLKDSLKLDGCLDLCCSDSSLDFATRHVEPLGTLILLVPAKQDAHSAIAIDMNAVVVNELVVMNVGDYREELPRALEVLVAQSS